MLQINRTLALVIKLYKENILSLEKATKLADCPTESFIDILGKFRIPIVSYSGSELAEELKNFE